MYTWEFLEENNQSPIDVDIAIQEEAHGVQPQLVKELPKRTMALADFKKFSQKK